MIHQNQRAKTTALITSKPLHAERQAQRHNQQPTVPHTHIHAPLSTRTASRTFTFLPCALLCTQRFNQAFPPHRKDQIQRTAPCCSCSCQSTCTRTVGLATRHACECSVNGRSYTDCACWRQYGIGNTPLDPCPKAAFGGPNYTPITASPLRRLSDQGPNVSALCNGIPSPCAGPPYYFHATPRPKGPPGQKPWPLRPLPLPIPQLQPTPWPKGPPGHISWPLTPLPLPPPRRSHYKDPRGHQGNSALLTHLIPNQLRTDDPPPAVNQQYNGDRVHTGKRPCQ